MTWISIVLFPVCVLGSNRFSVQALYVLQADSKSGYRGVWTSEVFDKQWDELKWGGNTHIMPGWNAMLSEYGKACAAFPPDKAPLLMPIVITDGKLEDGFAFEQQIAQLKGTSFVEVAVIGDEVDCLSACEHYDQIAKVNAHIRATRCQDNESAYVISGQVVSLLQADRDRLARAPPEYSPVDWPVPGPPVYE